MKFILTTNILSPIILILISIITTTSTTFLKKSCSSAQDCYILPGVLELACWYNVGKCNCVTTISTIHHIVSDTNTGACLMSKYGPCGSHNGSDLTVGCLDGFKCINNQCLNPNSSSTSTNNDIKYETPYVFEDSSCDHENGCEFSDELQFICGRNDNSKDKCVCEQPEIADKPSPFWDLRNYDGTHNCSVGQFGPCGSKHGLHVECHGVGLQCINNKCINPSKPLSSLNEGCDKSIDCEPPLVCSSSDECIKPKSLEKGSNCRSDEECKVGLRCKRFRWRTTCT